MALRDLLGELKENTLTTARSVGTGASLGFVKYPAASVMMLADRVMADNPQLTFRQALALINEQQQRDRAERPVAAFGGEIAGSLVPGAGLVRAGTSLPGAIGTGAAMGAAGAYNENQEPNAILPGAAFGAVGGGAGRLVQSGQEKAVRFAASRVGAQRADEAAQAITVRDEQIAQKLDAARRTGKLTGEQKREIAKLERSRRSLVQSQRKGEELARVAEQGSADELFAATRPSIKDGKLSFGALAGSGISDVLGTTRGRIAADSSASLNNAIFGAGAGAGLSHLLGADPILGAMLGGGSGRFLGPVLKGKAAGLATLPQATAPAMAAAAIPFASRGVAEAAQVQQAADDFSDFTEEEDFSDLVEE